MKQDSRFMPVSEIRALFARSLSKMYGEEVPLYNQLVDTVTRVNRDVMSGQPGLERELGSLERVSEERHGAIRVGTPEEMRGIAQLFSVLGMYPVDYYDLTVAGLPIHSTAFRPIEKDELAKNPFRVFTSLLRLDIIAQNDSELAHVAETVLAKRKIFTDKTLELIEINKRQGGLTPEQAVEFVKEAMELSAGIKKRPLQNLYMINC